MASIRDVARRAGVGVGTVSRVLNGTGYVSADTKKKIENAIEELEYKPNELARNLFRNKTGIVGVLVPDVDHPFFSSYVRQTEAALYGLGIMFSHYYDHHGFQQSLWKRRCTDFLY